jgi:hypothetical protein
LRRRAFSCLQGLYYFCGFLRIAHARRGHIRYLRAGVRLTAKIQYAMPTGPLLTTRATPYLIIRSTTGDRTCPPGVARAAARL